MQTFHHLLVLSLIGYPVTATAKRQKCDFSAEDVHRVETVFRQPHVRAFLCEILTVESGHGNSPYRYTQLVGFVLECNGLRWLAQLVAERISFPQTAHIELYAIGTDLFC